jgi:mRNA interferase RelE/StbE
VHSTWIVKWDPRAIKELKSISPEIKQRIFSFIEKKVHLSKNPRTLGEPLKGDKAGLWRYRIGDYRMICKLYDTELVVLVVKVGHRKAVYN